MNARLNFPALDREELIELVGDFIRFMSEAERKQFFSEIQNGYCPACGCSDPLGKCRCWEDE